MRRRSAARVLRVVRRAHRLHERGGWRRSVARRPAPDRQGDRALPRRLLAGVPDGGRSAICPSAFSPTAGCCSKNDKMSKSRGNIVRAEPIRQVMGADALRYFLLREDRLRAGWQLQLRRAGRPLQLGSGQRPGQPGQPHADDDPPVPRAARFPEGAEPEIAGAGERHHPGRRRHAFDRFEFSKGLEAIWALISAVDKFIVERAPWKLARQQRRRTRRRQLDDHALHRRRSAAHRHRAGLSGAAGVRAEDLGAARHDRAHRIRALRHARTGAVCRPGQRIGEVAARLPAHRGQRRHRQNARAGREGHRRAGGADGQEGRAGCRRPNRHPPRSPSTISSRWICASAWC